MNIQIHNGLGARFKLQVKKTETNEIINESAWSENIVLDSGLARMSVGNWFDRCCVGTGNSIPVVGQLALDNFLASSTTRQATTPFVETAVKPYHYGVRFTWRFGVGVAAGNISEVGIGWANNALWDRALVKDANGNPTTITVLSDEYLDVVSEIRVYPKDTITGSFQFLNKLGAVISTHNFTGRPCITQSNVEPSSISPARFKVYSGGMGADLNPPAGNLVANIANPDVARTYPTPTSFKATCKVGLEAGNGGIHRSFLIEMYGPLLYVNPAYKFEIDPPLSKTNLQEITYTITGSWGRYNAA